MGPRSTWGGGMDNHHCPLSLGILKGHQPHLKVFMAGPWDYPSKYLMGSGPWEYSGMPNAHAQGCLLESWSCCGDQKCLQLRIHLNIPEPLPFGGCGLEAADCSIYDPVGCAEFVWSLGWAVQQFQSKFPGLVLPPARQTLLELFSGGEILSECKDKRWEH